MARPYGTFSVALPPFVLHHVALVIEFLLGQSIDKKAHAIRFQPKRVFQGFARHGFKVVGAIETGGAVHTSLPQIGARFFQKRDVLPVRVYRALKHHVLEQMSEPVRPGFSFLEPTWYQRFTCTTGSFWS